MELVWSAAAAGDLDEIVAYIEQDDSAAADRVEDRIVASVEKLLQLPKMGRIGRVNGTRELVVSGTPYLAAYCMEGETVVVLRVLHGAQQWPNGM